MPQNTQAVLLAGGTARALYPLTSATLPKALLPVCNTPLLHFPLAALERAGVRQVFVVTAGNDAAQMVQAFLEQHPPAAIKWEVVAVDPDCGSAGALRAIAPRLTSREIIVMAGDVVTNCNLSAMIMAHRVNLSTVTVLLGRTRTSPSADTKPGRAPKGVTYIGLDKAEAQLLCHAAVEEKQLGKLPVLLAPLKRSGPMTLRTDLLDEHVYIFSRQEVLTLLVDKPELSSLTGEVIPLLVQKQFWLPGSEADGGSGSGEDGSEQATTTTTTATASQPPSAGSRHPEREINNWQRFNHSVGTAGSKWPGWCGVVMVQSGEYCERMSTIQAFGEVNREVADPSRFEGLTGRRLSKYDNFVPPSAKLGTRTTVGSSCTVGEGTLLGDKCSIKRSVLGAGCRMGNNVKVANSVLMENVTVADGCDIRNCVIGSNCTISEAASLKDCQVGQGYTVAESADHVEEVLAIS